MGAAIAHRGPNDSGTFHDSSTGLGLAFRRLSIVDLSPQGHQPMLSASGRFVIAFNGEIYNYEEIRADLGAHQWRGYSDTEVMLEAVERWGLDSAVRRFVGMFAFALWDREEKKLFLVRDRLGIKPLYYGQVGGDFVFASELKAIRTYPNFMSEIDREVVALYMRHNYVPSPYCIYTGLRKLEPGRILVLHSGSIPPSASSFWSATDIAREGLESPFVGSDYEAIEQLRDKLMSAVRLRLIADVPLGAFLSGGIDSATVVALMQAQSNRPIKTFTIGFHEGEYDEARYARTIAAHLGTDHTELYLAPKDVLDVIPLLPSMFDEPFSDSSQIPTYLISKLARSEVTVSLSGDGGDELFGGYNRYALTRKIWNSIRRFPMPLRRAVAMMLQSVSPAGIDRMVRLLRPFVSRRMRITAPGDRAHKLAKWLTADDPFAMYVLALSHWDDSSVVLGSRESEAVLGSIPKSPWLTSIEEVMMLTDLLNYLPDDILTKLDRASMAVSLEARVPLLDHRVVEFAWKLPLRFKIRNGTRKWILRQVLNKYVPADLVDRPKMGFGMPIDGWLRGPLRAWAEDLLSSKSLAEHGWLNVDAIQTKWREHLSGSRNWQYLLWDVLVFQDWFLQTHTRTGDRPTCKQLVS